MFMLTDEQVAEGLDLIREAISEHSCDDDGDCYYCGTTFPCYQFRRLRAALALQGRLEQEQRALVVAAKAIDGLRERLQAAEAEKNEARQALAYYRDAEAHAAVCTIGPAARQQARREAFEEAAKAMCLDCAIEYEGGEWEANTWLHVGQIARYKCPASPIRLRALAEVER